ncbi:hypothetical protein VB774_11545 [Pseudanabaena galeata UHCC 0370]|uniref:Spore coat protein U domain-containing protein n=1 Tax=Pseudanabaena galeata UHCC 0370 TaxID=3110310 RepID=A0ABU5TJ29_9CYAN|nr:MULTISPECIES: hypothetical protein [Pseudanabaena]MEA5478250.1 hypothetical protein [Pseudanabaena galeata UHCC 0370]MEA5487178.1 hypothetical protein [Pseudanabaena sp. CCNP1317]WGS73510.1 hypothetical protein OA858_05635 [Pseudanabaena galeata CCNP1313]
MFKKFSISFLLFSSCYYLCPFPAFTQVNSITFSSTTISPPVVLIPNTALPNTLIGKVNIKTDNANGFIVNAKSINGGALKRSSGELIDYTVNYNGIEQGQLETTDKTVENVSTLITDCASTNGCDRSIQIAISQSAISAKPAGSYSDQLTFTFVAK